MTKPPKRIIVTEASTGRKVVINVADIAYTQAVVTQGNEVYLEGAKRYINRDDSRHD